MKYFLFLCIIFVLAKFTEQQVVVLNSAKKVVDETEEAVDLKHSLEAKNVDSSETEYVVPLDGSVDSCTDEDDKAQNNIDEQGTVTTQEPDEANKRGQSKSGEKVDNTYDDDEQADSNEKASDDSNKSSKDSGSSSDSDREASQFIFIRIPNKLSTNNKKHKTKLNGPIKIGYNEDERSPHWNRWLSEIGAGNNAEIMGTNPHIYQPDAYPHLNRRFVLQYPYTEEAQNVMEAPDNKEIIPIQAPLEVVKKVLKQSVLEEAAKPHDDSQDLIRKKILRTGDYWNAMWVEEMDPKSALRMSNNPVLGVIKAKIKPGSEFYDMVAGMRKISPRLLYIINDKEK